MNKYEELEDALSLAGELCTSEQIRDLLRRRRGDNHVRISAQTKEDLVSRNLRAAVEAGSIDLQEVFDLIRLSEENGNQHVFYYRPKAKATADALTYESVAQLLWGSVWEKEIGRFPLVRLTPNDYRYTDFRRQNPKKAKDWLLKVYGHSVITRFTGKTERRNDNTLWREFVEEPLRTVLVVRWNSPNVLELRVQRNESRKRVEEWRGKLWSMLSPAAVPQQFEPWNLEKSISRLILEQDKHTSVYNFRDARVLGEGIQATFQTYADQGNLFESSQARNAIKGFMAADSDCNGLTVTWLPNSNQTPQTEIRTLLGSKESNEMIVPGHCLSGDLDYVTDQLRKFSKPAP